MNYEQMSFFLVTFVTVLYICQLIISIILYATNPFFSKVQKGVPEDRREERRVEESGSSMLSEDRSLGFSGAESAVPEAPGAEALREQGFTTAGLCEKYIALKSNIKHSTLDNYRYALDIIRTDEIAELPAVSLCPSDAKSFLGRLQASGRSYSAILSARSVLKQSYGSAVEDGLLKRNPFDFPVSEAVVNTSGKRQALTREQRDSFLKFVRDTKGLSANYDTFYILFHTGLRVSELCGLTLSDIDLKARSVKVSHQLQRTRDMRYIVETTKTESGARVLPV